MEFFDGGGGGDDGDDRNIVTNKEHDCIVIRLGTTGV
jgi:hypothetical protein